MRRIYLISLLRSASSISNTAPARNANRSLKNGWESLQEIPPMPQVFSARMNVIARASIVAHPWLLACSLWVGLTYDRSSYGTGMGVSVVQPVPFSHQHHVGILGIDCRYCHTSVEHSSFAGMPPTKTCMNCHSQIWVGSQMLEPVRESYRTQSIAPLAASL